MAHNRKLVIGGVALVKTRLHHDVLAMSEVRDELEAVLEGSSFFSSAPFGWIGLIIRFGMQDNLVPTYRPINKQHGDLPIAVEVDVRCLIGADKVALKESFRRATMAALLHVAGTYNLDSSSLDAYGRRIAESTGPLSTADIRDDPS